MKLSSLIVVVLLQLSLIQVPAQSVTVNLLSGSQAAYNLSDVLNMKFSNGTFSVLKKSATDSYPLSNFRNLKFSSGVVTSTMLDAIQKSFCVFPNPFINNISVSSHEPFAQGATIQILSVDGKLLKSQVVSGSSTMLNLSDLSSGFYFCNLKNGNENKTIKIIKN